jgi:hypothetical protein
MIGSEKLGARAIKEKTTKRILHGRNLNKR